MELFFHKHHYHFGFRYENSLKKRASAYCERHDITLNSLVEEAVIKLSHLHEKRNVNIFNAFSGFAARMELADRVDTMLILKAAVRAQLKMFAACYRKSMAEIVRIALELFLDWVEPEKIKSNNVKHYHSQPQMTILFSFFDMYPIHPPPEPPPPP